MQAPAWIKLPPFRRWLQIRLRTIFLVATAICIYFAWPHLVRQYAFWRLCSYGDLDRDDLWTVVGNAWRLEPKSADTHSVEKLILQLIGERDDPIPWNLDKPWLLRRIN